MSTKPPQAKWRKLPRTTTHPTTGLATVLTPPSKPGTRPFRFFDLPRELRDLVYDECLTKQHDDVVDESVEFRFQVPQGPEHSFFLVSRQFHRECLERMEKTTVVVLRNITEYVDLSVVPPSLAKCSRVHVEDEILDFDASTHVPIFSEGLLAKLQVFPQLQHLTLSVELFDHTFEYGLKHFLEDLKGLLSFPCLEQIKVQRFSRDLSQKWSTWDRDKDGYALWTPVGAWQLQQYPEELDAVDAVDTNGQMRMCQLERQL